MKITSIPFALLVALAATGTLRAQTTLSVNGQATSGLNGDFFRVEKGTVMTLVISNAGHAGGLFGLYAAQADNGSATGWWLDSTVDPIDPLAVLTGPSTVVLSSYLFSNDGLAVTFDPPRAGSPSLTLDGSGDKVLRFRIPESLSLSSINIQVATQLPGAIQFEYSDGVTLDFSSPPVSAARLVISRDLGGSVDSVEFGVLQFNLLPSLGLYTPDATLTDVDVLPVLLSSPSQWQSHSSGGVDHADDIDVFRDDRPAVRFDNDAYPRISLPPNAGADGVFGNADDVPARDLLRCMNNGTGNEFFLLINRGSNPNVAGDFHIIAGSSIAGTWFPNVAFNADGTRMFAAIDSQGANTDQAFLFSTDGSVPFGGAESAEITPGNLSSLVYAGRHVGFTAENVYYVFNDLVEDGGADADGFAHHLYSAPILSSAPVANEISIPTTGANQVSPDIVGEGSLISSADGSILVFLAGDFFSTVPVDNLQEADWYRVRDSSPLTASNFTQMAFVSEDGSLPKFFVPGEAFDGTAGFASLSPEGRRLAFVAQHHDENGSGGEDDDEVYLVSTNGTETAGLLAKPISTNGRFDSVGNPNFNNAQDLYLYSDTELMFFYGVNITEHTGTRRMDLFHYNSLDDVLTSVTGTSGETEIPFSIRGNVYPEGYFVSQNDQYLYFARGTTDGSGVTNLVGVDLTGVSAFNITGAEFGGVPVEATERLGARSDNHAFQLHYASAANGGLMYFAGRVTSPVATLGQEVWAFDADFPFGAFRLTDETNGAGFVATTVETLTPDPFGLGAGWAWALASGSTTDCDLFHLDLTQGLVDNLTGFGSIASALSGMTFIDARSSGGAGGGAVPPALVSTAGFVGTTDNPTNAVFTYTLLDSSGSKGVAVIGDTGGTLGANILQVYHASYD